MNKELLFVILWISFMAAFWGTMFRLERYNKADRQIRRRFMNICTEEVGKHPWEWRFYLYRKQDPSTKWLLLHPWVKSSKLWPDRRFAQPWDKLKKPNDMYALEEKAKAYNRRRRLSR